MRSSARLCSRVGWYAGEGKRCDSREMTKGRVKGEKLATVSAGVDLAAPSSQLQPSISLTEHTDECNTTLWPQIKLTWSATCHL